MFVPVPPPTPSVKTPPLAVLYRIGYTSVSDIRQTKLFARWFKALRDPSARARILVRIRRLSLGNPGDVRPVGHGVSELRVDYGPGYRVYFVVRGDSLIILLAGGEKRTQHTDIETAISLAQTL